jgi:hypothetical protein
MVVIPTSRTVTIHYDETPVDLLGWALTFLGVIAVIFLSRRPFDEDDDFAAMADADENDEPSLRPPVLTAELEPQPA